MGIQVWLVVIGVSAMTLIVWDGWRRKVAQRVSQGASEQRAGDTDMPAAAPLHDRHAASAPVDAAHTGEAEPATVPELAALPESALMEEGSRIGSATRLTGKLVTSEPMLVKGHIDGALYACHHPVAISASGEVSSYLEGGTIHVDGRVTGIVKANIKLTLLSRAHVQGEIEAASLECAAGAWLQTNVTQQSRANDPLSQDA